MIGGKSISGFVITGNEEENVRACLESMKWVDELVVVDSHSQDATVEIARQYTDRIIQHDFAGHVAQTRFAFEQTTCEWVLWLDADERLTDQAEGEVRRAFEQPGGPACDGFAFPRRTYLLGRWITHGVWYPKHKLRLMRREAAAIVGEEPHPEAVVEGKVKKLNGDILHHSYPGGILDYVRSSARYADLAARNRFARGKGASMVHLVFGPPLTFLKSYVLKLGFLDGVPGMAVAAGTAYHKFIRDLRLWEMTHVERPQGSDSTDAGASS